MRSKPGARRTAGIIHEGLAAPMTDVTRFRFGWRGHFGLPSRAMPEPASTPRAAASRVRVRYKETDQMGIAHHANYLPWFEIGRTDLCRLLGTSYRAIEEQGLLLVVTEIGCRYRLPYRYDDEVVIRTTVDLASARGMRFRYELYDATGTTLHASGFSSHVWLDAATRRPISVRGEMLERFAACVERG
jgi:acyl-CoA thioester hydrolase